MQHHLHNSKKKGGGHTWAMSGSKSELTETTKLKIGKKNYPDVQPHTANECDCKDVVTTNFWKSVGYY